MKFRKIILRIRDKGILPLVTEKIKDKTIWKWHTFWIRYLYFKNKKTHKITAEEKAALKELVKDSKSLVDNLCAKYKNKYKNRNDLRFLLHTPAPSQGHHSYYMEHLIMCMHYMGLNVKKLKWTEENYKEIFGEFKPNIFMSLDQLAVFDYLDLEFIHNYKKENGLLRMLSLIAPNGIPDHIRLSKGDKIRLEIFKNNKSADVFYSLMEDDFFDLFMKQWKEAGGIHLSIPLAANPLMHYPIYEKKDLDWGFVASNADHGKRAEMTYRYFRKILSNYSGEIRGYNWGKGISPIKHSQVGSFLSRVKISPNPRTDIATKYPTEIGGKVYELGAMGIFQIASNTKALSRYYNSDEIVTFSNAKEFNCLFDYFINKPIARYGYAKRAMRKTFDLHTYFHRVDKIISFIDSNQHLL